MTADRRGPFVKRILLLYVIVATSMVLAVACNASSGSTSSGDRGSSNSMQGNAAGAAYSPNIDPARFTTSVDNEYFPLKPGTTFVYNGKTADSTEGDTVAVTPDTRNVMGVECVVVKDTVTENGKMTEKTYDWYAQDDKGSVWYFGEDSGEYQNGKLKTKEGSWEAGKHGAQPGIIMPADPKVGHVYRQEYRKGVAEDMAKPLKIAGSANVPYGSFDQVLVTDEWTPLEKNVAEQKYYAGGVGTVLEKAIKGPKERLELVSVKHG
jgi:hypothetical protein